MKKVASLIFFAVCIGFLMVACKHSMTYADYVERENDRINEFIKAQNITVLKEYPKNGVFKEKEFYLDSSGVYINVVDSGNGKRAVARDDVYFRFSGAVLLPVSESDTVNLSDYHSQPLNIIYGLTTTYTNSSTSYIVEYSYLSPGLVVPLQYVGEGAIVRLIVPFRNSIGSALQSSYYATYYFDKVEYTTILH
jgi:hypothetical protein